MPSPEAIETVPSFATLEDLQGALDAKQAYAPVDLYPRDGTHALSTVEHRVAKLVGVEGDELILCTSGMAAVVTALETFRSNDSVIAVAEETYSQTAAYLQRLAFQGTKVVRFDSGCTQSLDRVVSKHKPTIILTETIGNGPSVPVFDAEEALGLKSVEETQPTVILDNTLPLSSTYPLDKVLSNYPHVVGVESGTKAYTFNKELSGLLYSHNSEVLGRLRQTRRTIGATPGIAAVNHIDQLLPDSRIEFDERNAAVFAVTTALANQVYEAAGYNPDYFVAHPALPNHPNYQPTAETPSGSPVFFISCLGGVDQFELTQKLWDHPDIRRHAQLGQSFGFDETRILPDSLAPIVRIAGGAKTDTNVLGQALAEAIA